MQDWAFEYTFGASNKPTELYFQQTKHSQDLVLQTERRPRYFIIKEEIVLPGAEITRIFFTYEEPPCGSGDVMVEMTDRSVHSVRGFPFKGSDSFLSDKRYVFEKNLYFVGRVRTNGTSNEFKYEFSRSCLGVENRVEEIRFK